MLRVYADDSSEVDPPVFVVAGYVATSDEWKAFEHAWDHALRGWKLPYFKMSEAADRWSADVLTERVSYLYSIIDEHTTMSFSSTLNPILLKKVMRGQSDQHLDHPYIFTFLYLFSQLTRGIQHLRPGEDMEFIFDEQMGEKKIIAANWAHFMSAAPDNVRKHLAREPIFGDDVKHLPIQAADFLAWWRRRRYLEKFHDLPRIEIPRLNKRTRPVAGPSHTLWTEQRLIEWRNGLIMNATFGPQGVQRDEHGNVTIRMGPFALVPVPRTIQGSKNATARPTIVATPGLIRRVLNRISHFLRKINIDWRKGRDPTAT